MNQKVVVLWDNAKRVRQWINLLHKNDFFKHIDLKYLFARSANILYKMSTWNNVSDYHSWIANGCSINTNLKQLNLGNNLLTSLPVEIGNLISLQELYLDANLLTSLPVEIGNLTNLKGLYLGRNQLTSLPVEIGNLISLQELYLDAKIGRAHV